VAEGVRRHNLHPLIVDPVMVATSGDLLLEPEAVEALRRELVPLAELLTPNLAEAASLLNGQQAVGEGEMQEQARALLALGARAVLIKGGHAEGAEAIDILVAPDAAPVRLAMPRIATRNAHGTGCTLSAAIAAHLARGESLNEAVFAAKRFVHAALAVGSKQKIGMGDGPVDHLATLREPRKS
jgi:hydroxymethylpyrimidine/phosphomethylpyrimidine kinase